MISDDKCWWWCNIYIHPPGLWPLHWRLPRSQRLLRYHTNLGWYLIQTNGLAISLINPLQAPYHALSLPSNSLKVHWNKCSVLFLFPEKTERILHGSKIHRAPRPRGTTSDFSGLRCLGMAWNIFIGWFSQPNGEVEVADRLPRKIDHPSTSQDHHSRLGTQSDPEPGPCPTGNPPCSGIPASGSKRPLLFGCFQNLVNRVNIAALFEMLKKSPSFADEILMFTS